MMWERVTEILKRRDWVDFSALPWRAAELRAFPDGGLELRIRTLRQSISMPSSPQFKHLYRLLE